MGPFLSPPRLGPKDRQLYTLLVRDCNTPNKPQCWSILLKVDGCNQVSQFMKWVWCDKMVCGMLRHYSALYLPRLEVADLPHQPDYITSSSSLILHGRWYTAWTAISFSLHIYSYRTLAINVNLFPDWVRDFDSWHVTGFNITIDSLSSYRTIYVVTDISCDTKMSQRLPLDSCQLVTDAVPAGTLAFPQWVTPGKG